MTSVDKKKKTTKKSLVILIPALERCCTKTKLFDSLDLKLEVPD